MPHICQNCSTPFEGEFCPSCGQPAASIDLPVGAFARDFASEALSLDSRVRHTLGPLFFRPGVVAKEYVEGHRARFVPPVRLYLLASFAMFLVLSQAGLDVNNVVVNGEQVLDSAGAVVAPSPDEVPTRVDEGEQEMAGGDEEETLQGVFFERIGRGFERLSADQEGFSRLFFNRLAQGMFFLLPAFALLLKIAYRRRLYVHHAVFAVYLHSFAFMIVAASALPDALGMSTIGRWTPVILLVVPVHLLMAMKRFYDESWPRTILKCGAVSWFYMSITTITVAALLVVSLLTI